MGKLAALANFRTLPIIKIRLGQDYTIRLSITSFAFAPAHWRNPLWPLAQFEVPAAWTVIFTILLYFYRRYGCFRSRWSIRMPRIGDKRIRTRSLPRKPYTWPTEDPTRSVATNCTVWDIRDDITLECFSHVTSYRRVTRPTLLRKKVGREARRP